MGLVTNKKILLRESFPHNDDPFYAQNTKLKTVAHTTLPSDANDVMIDKNQPIFYAVNYVLSRLLDNDRFIKQFIEKAQSKTISKDKATKAFDQTGITSLSSDIFEKAVADHLHQYHTPWYPEGSDELFAVQLSTIVNEYVKNDFSNFLESDAKNNFLKPSGVDIIHDPVASISNDVVVEMEFDDSQTVNNSTNYILVSVCNKRTDGKFRYSLADDLSFAVPSTRESKYIYKRWLSGLKEFFIYIPSTFTFYSEQPNPQENTTFIQLKINRRHFKLNHIYSMHICGQSLPMQIHMVDKHYFNDTIQPSVVRTLCISDSSDNNVNCIYDENTSLYTIYFACSGTDAQAIKLICDQCNIDVH